MTLVRKVCLCAIGLTIATSPVVSDDILPDLTNNAALRELLRRFDQISAAGYVPTQRRGSTGIGHTLERLLGVEENNDPGGDFRGIEIKAARIDNVHKDRRKRVNLFLKEPHWLDNWSAAERIRKLGYVDPNGREALYQTVTARDNSAGMRLEVDSKAGALLLLQNADAIAYWDNDVLQKRLAEKHAQTVFVGATARGAGVDEEFRYQSLVWCSQPSPKRFLQIAADGDVLVELRMHVAPSGNAATAPAFVTCRSIRSGPQSRHRVSDSQTSDSRSVSTPHTVATSAV